jgi:cell division protein FtsL
VKLLYFAIIALVAFVAFWVLVVVPAERRHHERKLEALRKRIEKRETRLDEDDRYGAPDDE